MPQNGETTAEKLRFIFTEKNFTLDLQDALTSEEILEWKQRFESDRYQALYDLGFEEKPDWLDAAGGFLYQTADQFQRWLTSQPDLELLREKIQLKPDEEIVERLLHSVPFALGSEHVNTSWISRIFDELRKVFAHEIADFQGSVSLYLADKCQHLRAPERIFFHLVESGQEDYPFAFLATYATRDETDRVRHMPLQYALTEYGTRREKLLELLACLNRAAEASPLIGEFVEKGELFHPLRLSAWEAYQILKDVPEIEKMGIVCRIPNWWKRNAYGVSLTVSIGDDKPPLLGMESILSMRPQLTVDGVPLSREEIEQLLAQTEGLALLKGKWIEVDHARLRMLLEEMEEYRGELTLIQALRMELGVGTEKQEADVGPIVTNGKWLAGLMRDLRVPKHIRKIQPPKDFGAVLRPYQNTGYRWLNYMSSLGFGACLADDMGLGKTVQVLAFLERLRKEKPSARVLLLAPASLLGNWQKETEKFAPKMPVTILHGGGAKHLGEIVQSDTAFLTITTYGMAVRIEPLAEIFWECIILDEAQAIKNPTTKQTKAVKKLQAGMRIAMTGTPIENDLTNLWSLFDFLDKGLLGSFSEFRDFCKGLEDRPEGYARLKSMISPFMLRRVKTDKEIISDLPDKLEQVDYVSLSKKQTVLYRKYVAELEEKLTELDGMQRRGLVLAALTKLKQVCNHPDQYLGQAAYDPAESGKFELLRELCETIYEKRERVLVFTQFKEIIPYLNHFLAEIFHGKGFTLHGGTPVEERSRMVESFQGEEYVPYMILSVKAGGTGLTLTRAAHVIHFDRWWNPAVENQATDRAYRIGQKNNVMVHKLVCKGTIEEKIDALIASKRELAENVIGSGGENWITEMSNEELLSVLRLD